MRRPLVGAIAALLSAASVAFVAGTRGTAPAEVGGSGPPPRENPGRVTPGRYDAPVFTNPGAQKRGERAQADDLARPGFEGPVNGVFVWSETPPRDPSFGARPCPEERIHPVPEGEQPGRPYFVETPSYLPPGAFELLAPQMLACEGGDVVHVGRVFELRPSGIEIGIGREIGRWAVPIGHAAASRVEAGTVGGKPAAFVRPVTREGFGTSWIHVREAYGVTTVTAFDLPFEELLRIAEAVVSDDAS